MKVEKKTLDRARELLGELEVLEEVKDVFSNYDARAYMVCRTLYNHNLKELKEVKVKMPPEVVKNMNEYIENRIFEIKKELETL